MTESSFEDIPGTTLFRRTNASSAQISLGVSPMRSMRSLLITCSQGVRRFPPAGDRRPSRRQRECPALAGFFHVSVRPMPSVWVQPPILGNCDIDRFILAFPCPSRPPIG